MKSLSFRHIISRKISKRTEDDLTALLKKKIKEDPKIIEKFRQYKIPLSDIDDVSITFCELDVSAKTKDLCIYINQKIMDEGIDKALPYLAHELVHYLQQKTGKNIKKDDNADYLDLPSEEEAFAQQINKIKRDESREAALQYIERLLNHHKLTGKDRVNKKNELMELAKL